MIGVLSNRAKRAHAEQFQQSGKAIMIRLPTQHLYFADGYSFDAYFNQGFPDIVQLEGLDDRLDLLHIRGIAILKNRSTTASRSSIDLRFGAHS
jgi:hypothetical protein